MAKVMLVEDDNNLREIYEARLLAEGYEIISAKDGEEALALAVKERPNLIISDIMMPNISGFDMLDILRSTPETKNTKVIMMTALSQAEDKVRANKLGADRYLVKSQVTLEDVVKVAKEVLEGTSDTPPTDIAAGISPSPTVASKDNPAPSAVEKPTEPAGGNKSEQKPPLPVESTSETSKQEGTTADNTSGETTATTPVDTTPKKPLQSDQPTATVPTSAEPTTAPNSNLEEDNSTGNDTIQTLPVVEVNENSSGDTAKNQTENAAADEQPASKPAEKATNSDTSKEKETEGQDPNLPDDIAATTTPPPLPEPEVVKPNEHNTPISTASETSLDEDDKPPTVLHTKVIKPLSDFKKQKTDFEALVAKEEAKETGATAEPVVQDVEPVKEGGEAPSPQTIIPTNENIDPNSVAL